MGTREKDKECRTCVVLWPGAHFLFFRVGFMGIETMVFCSVLGCLVSLLIIPLALLPGLLRSIHGRGGISAQYERSRRAAAAPAPSGIALMASFTGVAVLVWFICPSAVAGPREPGLSIVWATFLITCIGVWDDFRPLGIAPRLLLQALVSAAVFAQGLQVETFFPRPTPEPLSPEALCNGLVTVLWLVSLTNLVQVMDKVTGLAAGVGFGVLAIVAGAAYWSDVEFAALCAVGMAGALAGFLVYNLPPARIRLGSAGASLIGFLIACLTILIAQGGTILAASTVPFLAVLVLIAGAAYAVLRRGLGAAQWLPPGPKATPAAFPQRGVKPHAS